MDWNRYVKENIENTLKLILRLLLISMVFLTTLQVIMRYLLNSPLRWAEETIGILMIYFGLIGSSFGIYYGLHIALDIFRLRCSQKIINMINYFEILLFLLFGIHEIIYGIQLMVLTKNQTLPATKVIVSYTYLALPIAGITMLYFALEMIVRMKKGEKSGLGTHTTIR